MPKNVVLLIGDGMGFEQVKAAGMYAHGAPGTLPFEAFPHRAEMTTHSADSPVTESAAAATALATGRKVNNGVVSVAHPGGGGELKTLLEHFGDRGRGTGLVTTADVTHATPVAFGAHRPSRNDLSGIFADYLNVTRPNVLFGGAGDGTPAASVAEAGYALVTDRAGIRALDLEALAMVCGRFGEDHLPYEYDGLVPDRLLVHHGPHRGPRPRLRLGRQRSIRLRRDGQHRPVRDMRSPVTPGRLRDDSRGTKPGAGSRWTPRQIPGDGMVPDT